MPQQLLAVSAFAVALALSLAVYPFYIRWLKSKQIGQFIREEGPQSHATKAKTPTMGGLAFIATSSITAAAFLIYAWLQPGGSDHNKSFIDAFAVIGTGVLCGLVGFADDYAKVTSKSNKGLSAKTRLVIEFGLGAAFAALIYFVGTEKDLLLFPSGYAHIHEHPVLNLIYMLVVVPFIVAATTNAINLHDGMDGLAAGTSMLVFSTLGLMATMTSFIFAPVAYALVGALCGFLLFNRYPAKVFMGDTGSLFIGGVMAALVVASGLTIWFVPLALIYVAETLSVMAQVVYFKLTKDYKPEKPMSAPALVMLKLTKRLPGEGKRLFRMAPLHHHFEAVGADRGMPEWQVVACFWLAQLILCAFVAVAFLRLSGA